MKTSRNEALKFQTLFEEITSLEKVGKYAQAFQLISGIWSDISEDPNVAGMTPTITAETFLRCGAIIGHLGNSKQIFDAQEKAKNLLMSARDQYIKLYKPEKIAECENQLALAYFHKGEIKEANIWIDESLSHALDSNSETRLYSYNIKSAIYLGQSRYDEVVSLFESVQNKFEKASYLLKGSLATNLSLAYKNLGQLDLAIRYLNFAKLLHKKSNHLPYLATVENNLAQLYKLKRDFDKALEHADNAINCFTEIGDRARIAYAMDTKAQIYISKGTFDSALELSSAAIEMLQFGDNTGILSEVYLTKAMALVGDGRIGKAVIAISESLQLAKIVGNSKETQIADEFELSIRGYFPAQTKMTYSERPKTPDNLVLELPPEISPNQDFFGVWIKNKEFERTGLKKGNLAIVVKGKEVHGDLVAVCDNQTDLVSIGFFDNQYGLICLESYDQEPTLLDENQVTVMGKIVGYAKPETTVNGSYKVYPVILEKRPGGV